MDNGFSLCACLLACMLLVFNGIGVNAINNGFLRRFFLCQHGDFFDLTKGIFFFCFV